MGTYRTGLVFAILILIFSGCDVNSISPVKPYASMMNSPVSSEINTSPNATDLPTPSVEVTDADGIPSPTPSATLVDTDAAPTATTIKGNPGLFNEDTFSKYFHFGMSMKAVEKELKVLKIKITYKSKSDSDYPPEWGIATDDIQFQFDNNKRLYEIDVANWETAKGYVPGESSEILRQLYGKEDEVEYSSSPKFIYAKEDCYFSVEIGDASVSDENLQFWSVFVDIWNDPHILDKGAKSSAFMAGKFTNDDAIQFNEDNFSAEYPIGMSRQALVKKLNRKQVRITGEVEFIGNGDDDESTPGEYLGCIVSTDHVTFEFDSTKRLSEINVCGWPTAKGLSQGDSEEKLVQLYGEAASVLRNSGGDGDIYAYGINGYTFTLRFGDYFHPLANEFSYWSVSRDE